MAICTKPASRVAGHDVTIWQDKLLAVQHPGLQKHSAGQESGFAPAQFAHRQWEGLWLLPNRNKVRRVAVDNKPSHSRCARFLGRSEPRS